MVEQLGFFLDYAPETLGVAEVVANFAVRPRPGGLEQGAVAAKPDGVFTAGSFPRLWRYEAGFFEPERQLIERVQVVGDLVAVPRFVLRVLVIRPE
ncbi:hypothetical protein [Corynebacterium propinquum]